MVATREAGAVTKKRAGQSRAPLVEVGAKRRSGANRGTAVFDCINAVAWWRKLPCRAWKRSSRTGCSGNAAWSVAGELPSV